jgi:hypothetical protein
VSQVLQNANVATDDETFDRTLVQKAFAADVLVFTGEGINGWPRALRELLDFCNELSDRSAEIDKRVDLSEDCESLAKQLGTTIAWVNEWPVPALRRRHLDQLSNDPLKTQALVGMIDYHEEEAFLRRANVTLPGKLRLTLLVLAEELGLALVNSAWYIQPMCYLYMTTKKHNLFKRNGFGYSQEQPNDISGPFMKDLELLCQRHKQEIFGGDWKVNLGPAEPGTSNV